LMTTATGFDKNCGFWRKELEEELEPASRLGILVLRIELLVCTIGAWVALHTELDDQQKIDIHELTLSERCLLCRKGRFWVSHYKTHFVLVEISFQSLKVVTCHKHGGWLLLCSKEFLYCERKHSDWTSNHPGSFSSVYSQVCSQFSSVYSQVCSQFSSSSVQSIIFFVQLNLFQIYSWKLQEFKMHKWYNSQWLVW
jgi:hypothetical protein